MGKRSKKRKLKKRLARKQSTPIKTHLIKKLPQFKNNHGNVVTALELVFPIVRQNEDESFEGVGTGFFIHPAGGFVTAKHCVPRIKTGDPTIYYGIHTIGPGHQEMRKILYFEPHQISDIGVGMLKGSLVNPQTKELVLHTTFPISLSPPNIGDNIYTLAYPRMHINNVKGTGLFPCDQYNGEIIDHRSQGSGKLQSEVFITTMPIESGASGGPALKGCSIIGVNSTSMNIVAGVDPISFITPISHVFDLTLRDSDGKNTTIQELMDNGHMAFVK